MSCYEVYRNVALEAIEQYRNLDVFSYAWQTANFDYSWPSWIPKWDTTVNDLRLMSIVPFVYNADHGKEPVSRHGTDASGLIVQGLSVDVVTQCNAVLDFEDLEAIAPGKSVEDTLKTMSLLLVHDKRELKLGDEKSTERASSNFTEHFEDFAAYLLMLLRDDEHSNSFIQSENLWCNVCHSRIADMNRASSAPLLSYSCRLCKHSDFDLCMNCYSSGVRCNNSEHAIDEWANPGFKIPGTRKIKELLESHARYGNAKRFSAISSLALKKRVFLRTAHGRIASGSWFVEPGDFIVVLFGSRVPFVVRKRNSCYRLISDCYIHGFMDGEVIELWRNGVLQTQDFELR
jgi:hypothetical protein